MFSFFKKKKKPENKDSSPDKVTQSTGKSGTPSKKNDLADVYEPIPADQFDDQWMYDSLLQFLTSPLWKVPIYTFLDEHCIVFDDEEENKFAYTDVHNQFKKVIEELVETIMKELGITEEQFVKIMERGLKSPEHKKVFEQLLVVDNFLVFKKLMVKRNKELELEAMKQIEDAERAKAGIKDSDAEMDPQLEMASLEREQAQIEHAIAMSLAVEKERMKVVDQEDEDLQLALKMSQMEFQQEQEKVEQEKARQEAEKTRLEREAKKAKELQELKEKEAAAKKAEPKKEEPKKEEPTPISDQEAALMGMNASTKKPVIKKEEKKVEESVFDAAPKKTLPKLDPLPPLGKAQGRFEPMDLGQLLEEKEKVDSKVEEVKQKVEIKEEKKESLEERKERLRAQRELILAKKKAEREAELKEYKEEAKAGPSNTTASTQQDKPTAGGETVNNEESQKRSNVYKKLKDDLI